MKILVNIRGEGQMLTTLLIFILIGTVVYLYVEDRYIKLKLVEKSDELRKITAKRREKRSRCPAHFADRNNECRYNIHMKQFTCQFNPKHLANSGYFYNSPDICCNNRCAELNKILKLVIEEDTQEKKGGELGGTKVWCQRNNGVNCKEFNSPDSTCPTDALNNQAVPAFKTEAECNSFGKMTICNDRGRESCFNQSNCIWVDNDNSVDNGKCVYGTPSGPYYARTDASVGYIDGPATAVAGNTNPYFMVSTFEKKKDREGGEGGR